MTLDPSVTASSLADELLELVCQSDPLGASLLGLPGYDDGLADMTLAAEERYGALFGDLADRAAALEVTSETDRQTRDFVAHVAGTTREVSELRTVEWTITDFFVAPAATLIDLLPRVPLVTPEKAAGFLARLGQFPSYFAAVGERHREGVAAGRVPIASLVRAAIDHLDRVLADEDLSGLRVAGGPGVADQEAFATERDRLLAEAVVPALTTYRDLLRDEMLPAGRPDDRVGLTYLPGGERIYATLARKHTSTNRTPEELHQVGLQIISALEAEYAETGSRVFGTSDQTEIFRRLRTDPALRYSDSEEMLAQARSAVDRAWAAAPGWFGRLPSTECVVEPVPAAAAPGAPPAYYLPGAIDGSRKGTYFLNTSAPTERNRHMAEVVAFHEAVPGHHFQISLAQELTALPLARRLLNDTAYAEGGGCTASVWPTRWGCTPTTWRVSGYSRPIRGGPDGWSWTPGSTRWGGRGSRRWIGCSRTRRCRRRSARPRSIGTSRIPGRRCRTWSAGWRSSRCGPEPRRSSVIPSSSRPSTTWSWPGVRSPWPSWPTSSTGGSRRRKPPSESGCGA